VREFLMKKSKVKEVNFMKEEPCNIELECSVMKFSLLILNGIYKARFKGLLDDDKKLLQDASISSRMQFALVYRINIKEIFNINIHYITFLQKILLKVRAGASIKEAYMNEELDCPSYLQDIRVLRNYLMDLYINKRMLLDKTN
jgi:hypothetical protein